jgi:serralysin
LGNDTFRFMDAPSSDSTDAINGYVVADDKIQLDDAVFAGLAVGALAAAAFHAGTAAGDADDRIIYDPGSGALYFDPDGSGAAAEVQFATLSPGLAMAAGEFFVI